MNSSESEAGHFQIVEIQPDFDPLHLEGFVKLYKTVFGEPPYNEVYEDQLVADGVWFPHLREGCVFLILDGEKVIGLGCAVAATRYFDPAVPEFLRSIPDLPFKIENVCYMSEMGVAPGYRRKGVGERLIKARWQWAQRQGLTHYVFRTAHQGSNSERLYLRLGAQDMPGGVQNVSMQVEKIKSESKFRKYLYGSVLD